MSDTNSESSDGSLTVMGKTIPPQQAKSLLNFFEADHQLTLEDRGILADDLVNARSRQLISGMLTSLIALFTPSVIKHYRDQARAKLIGSTSVKRPVFANPSASISIACLVYFATMYFSGKVSMDLKIEQLSHEQVDYLLDEKSRESKTRQLSVWKAISADRLPLFAYYYQDTAVNPDHIMKDPRKMAAEQSYLPNSSNTRGSVIDSVQLQHPSAWSQVRQKNGFSDTSGQFDTLITNQGDGSIIEYMSAQNENDGYSSAYSSDDSHELLDSPPSFLEKPNKEESKPLSAWDRVRRGN